MSASALAWKRVKCARAYPRAATAPAARQPRLSAWLHQSQDRADMLRLLAWRHPLTFERVHAASAC